MDKELKELSNYNKCTEELIVEAKIYLSFFESEINRIDDCDILYKDGSLVAPSFAEIQQVMFSQLLLSVGRLFEEGHDYNKTYNIKRLLEKSELLCKKLQKSVNNNGHVYNVKEKIETFKNEYNNFANLIVKIKTHRDKRLAHNQKNIKLEDFNTMFGISLSELKGILNYSLEVTNFITFCIDNCSLGYKEGEDELNIEGLDFFNELFHVTAIGLKKIYEDKKYN